MVSSAASSTLERRLGPLDAAAIIVSNVIGGGILFTPPLIAAGVPNPWLFLGIWVAGGILAFCGASAYAELAALRPRAGGEYVYLRAAYGPLAGFLTGWVSFVAGFAGAIAAQAIVLVFYLDRFFPGAADHTPFFVVPIPYFPLTLSRRTLVAISAVVALSYVHYRGVGPGRLLMNFLAVLKVSALMIFIAAGFSLGAGSVANMQQVAGPVTGSSWLLALLAVMFTYSGWNAASYMAEEIRDPGRNVPKALALGTGAVIVVYLLLNTLYLYVMPVAELAQVQGSVLDVVADRVLGSAAGNIMGVVSIVSLLASVSANIFAGPRVYYAMARDGVFLPAAAHVHPKFRTPSAAIVAQAIWASILIMWGGADTLTTYTGFAVTLFATVAVAAVFVLRHREPNAERPFSAWGYPFTPALFVVVGTATVLNAVYTAPYTTLAGLGVMAAGIPLFLYFGGKRERTHG